MSKSTNSKKAKRLNALETLLEKHEGKQLIKIDEF